MLTVAEGTVLLVPFKPSKLSPLIAVGRRKHTLSFRTSTAGISCASELASIATRRAARTARGSTPSLDLSFAPTPPSCVGIRKSLIRRPLAKALIALETETPRCRSIVSTLLSQATQGWPRVKVRFVESGSRDCGQPVREIPLDGIPRITSPSE